MFGDENIIELKVDDSNRRTLMSIGFVQKRLKA